jgi:signal peptide peptidase SppA
VQAITSISEMMPVWAIANSAMNSAGYWLGSAADRVLATPYARVGSIGVVAMHVDISKALAKRGIVTTFIHAGKHKIDGNSFEPLSASAKRTIAGSISEIYDQFCAHVASARRIDEQEVRDTEARVYSSREALEINLIDDISTLSSAIAAMRTAIQDRRRTYIQGMVMAKTYEDGLTEGKALGIQEGIATGTANATKAGEVLVANAKAEGATGERTRISAILTCEDAKGRDPLAQHLAFSTAMTAPDAEAILKASPKAAASKAPPLPKPAPTSDANQTAESILASMRANSPAVKAGEDDPQASDEDQRREEIRATLGTRYRRQPPPQGQPQTPRY